MHAGRLTIGENCARAESANALVESLMQCLGTRSEEGTAMAMPDIGGSEDPKADSTKIDLRPNNLILSKVLTFQEDPTTKSPYPYRTTNSPYPYRTTMAPYPYRTTKSPNPYRTRSPWDLHKLTSDPWNKANRSPWNRQEATRSPWDRQEVTRSPWKKQGSIVDNLLNYKGTPDPWTKEEATISPWKKYQEKTFL